MKKEDCYGCYNDDYNRGLGGAKECWSFAKDQKLVEKYLIPVDMRPPYSKDMIKKVPPCYKKQKFVCVDPKAIKKDGYWKN